MARYISDPYSNSAGGVGSGPGWGTLPDGSPAPWSYLHPSLNGIRLTSDPGGTPEEYLARVGKSPISSGNVPLPLSSSGNTPPFQAPPPSMGNLYMPASAQPLTGVESSGEASYYRGSGGQDLGNNRPRRPPDYYDSQGRPTWSTPATTPSANYLGLPSTANPTGGGASSGGGLYMPAIGTNANAGASPTGGAGNLAQDYLSQLMRITSGGGVGNALNTAGQVNQFNLDYYRNAMAGDPAYSEANRLLNPNDAQANYDVSMHGAEAGIGRGIAGSGAASETTGRLRQSDIERRAQLGSSLLSQAYGRTPQPFDVSKELLTPYQQAQLTLEGGHLSLQEAQLALDDRIRSGQLQLSQQDLALRDRIQSGELTLDQARLALQDRIQSGQLSVENARLMLDWYKALSPQYGGGGAGGGGRYSPSSGGATTKPTSTEPSWHTPGMGGGLPPFPDQGFRNPYNIDTDPAYTTNPYTNPESPYYAPANQGYDYIPPGGFDYSAPTDFYDQGLPDMTDYYA